MTHFVDATTPYPWPFDGGLSLERVALVVCGWTNHWWRHCVDVGTVTERIRVLADTGAMVVALDHRPPRRAALAELGGPPALVRAHTVTAAGIDGFYGGPLDAVLRGAGRDRLLLVGLGLETTVHSTMRSANDRGYECLLVADACAPVEFSAVPNAISMVEMSGGIFGAVGATNPALAALRGAHRSGDHS